MRSASRIQCLPQLVAGAVGSGVERLRLTTGGAPLAVGENAAGALDAGVRHLEIVCLSVDQERDEASFVSPFADVQRGLDAYRDAAASRRVTVAMVGRIVVCHHNVDSVPASVAALAASGVIAVTVDCALLHGAPDPAWVRATVDSGVVNRAWVVLEGSANVAGLTSRRQYRIEASAGTRSEGSAVMTRGAFRVALVGVNAPGYRSLALGYLRAYAQADPRLGDVAFTTLDLDTSIDPWWIAYRVLSLEPPPDVVALSVVCWNAQAVYEICRIIKATRPEVLVVVGGPEVGPISETVMIENAAIDVVVRGEGEATFADLVAVLAARSSPVDIAGTTVRAGETVVSAPGRDPIEDLDTIPSPYLSGIMRPLEDGTYIESYRGCPHACGYCFEGRGYKTVRRFSEERIAAEIEHIASHPEVLSLSFVDPVFNLTTERLRWMATKMAPHVARGVRLRTIEVDIERIGPAEARLLRDAGVASVETGPQSVGARALATCNRAFDAERFSAGVAALKAEGVSVECDLIIGLPGDTLDDVAAGLDFTIGLDPGRIQLSTLHVLPGTDLWNRADELGLRYDAHAPHEVIATHQMDYVDLRRAEVLGNAIATLYEARIGPGSEPPPA